MRNVRYFTVVFFILAVCFFGYSLYRLSKKAPVVSENSSVQQAVAGGINGVSRTQVALRRQQAIEEAQNNHQSAYSYQIDTDPDFINKTFDSIKTEHD